MTGNQRCGAALALTGVILAGVWAARARAGQEVLKAFVPADGAVAGWSRDGGLQEFAGEDLYTYIDGGAEIYQEYGFRRVVIQDFKNAAAKSVSLEIFEMETPAAAYGIFTFKRSGSGKSVGLGSGAELEDYYLNFWKGRFLMTLTGFDETEATLAGLLAIGGAVDGKIGEKAGAPRLVAALPVEGLRPQSVKYFKGLLGLNNIYPLYTARGLAFTEAVRGVYADGESLILLDYGSAEARSEAWLELRPGLEKSGRFEPAENYLADAVAFRDGKGQYVAFNEAGDRIAIAIASTLDWALTTVARVR
jgi:hypothetical protein